MHLRWLVQPPSSIPLHVATLRFNCSVNYGGLQFANVQEGIFFSENKEKSIHAALLALVEDDGSGNHVRFYIKIIPCAPSDDLSFVKISSTNF